MQSNETRHRYDFIIHDVFTGGAEPIDLFTLEFLTGLSSLLKSDGVIAIVSWTACSLPVWPGLTHGRTMRAICFSLLQSRSFELLSRYSESAAYSEKYLGRYQWVLRTTLTLSCFVENQVKTSPSVPQSKQTFWAVLHADSIFYQRMR